MEKMLPYEAQLKKGALVIESGFISIVGSFFPNPWAYQCRMNWFLYPITYIYQKKSSLEMSEPLQIQRGVARTMWISMLGENPSKFQVTICFLHKNKIDLFSLGMCGHFIRQSLKNHKVQLSPPAKKKKNTHKNHSSRGFLLAWLSFQRRRLSIQKKTCDIL